MTAQTLTAETLEHVPVALIDRSPDQYRETFDPDALAELAASIGETGLEMPVRVRPIGDGRYALIDGERRLRAVRDVLGAETILAVVDGRDRDPVELALATWKANGQRVDPGPLEDARGLARILKTFEGSVNTLAAKLGRSPRWVSERLALLSLAEDVAHWVQTGNLPIWKAVLMAELDNNRQRLALAAHESGLGADAFKCLVSKLLTEQSAECMFDTDSFLRLEEYVMEAENEAELIAAGKVVRERVLGMDEIAQLFEVKYGTVQKWRVRGLFPDPDFTAGGSPLWWEPTVLAWARETGRQ